MFNWRLGKKPVQAEFSENYTEHTHSKVSLFKTKVAHRKQVNQAWDFWLTIIGILITILVTVMGSVDTKIVKAPNNDGKDKIVTVLFGLDSEIIQIGIVCAGAVGVGLQSIIAAFPVRRKSNEYRELEARTDNLLSTVNRIFYEEKSTALSPQEVGDQLKQVNEELLQLRLRAANIETNPALAEVGIRFDQLIERLDAYQASVAQLPGDEGMSNLSRPRQLLPFQTDSIHANAGLSPQSDDDDLKRSPHPPQADDNPNRTWDHA